MVHMEMELCSMNLDTFDREQSAPVFCAVVKDDPLKVLELELSVASYSSTLVKLQTLATHENGQRDILREFRCRNNMRLVLLSF